MVMRNIQEPIYPQLNFLLLFSDFNFPLLKIQTFYTHNFCSQDSDIFFHYHFIHICSLSFQIHTISKLPHQLIDTVMIYFSLCIIIFHICIIQFHTSSKLPHRLIDVVMIYFSFCIIIFLM